MATTTNDFKATGIKGLNVSWRQDIQPELARLRAQGWDIQVLRKEVTTPKYTTYVYVVTAGPWIPKYLFATNSVASVWTFLLGFGEALTFAPEDPMASEAVKSIIAEKEHARKAALTELSIVAAEKEAMATKMNKLTQKVTALKTVLFHIRKATTDTLNDTRD